MNLRVGVWGLGFGVWGLGFGVWGLGFKVWGVRFGIWNLGCGVKCLGFRIFGLDLIKQGARGRTKVTTHCLSVPFSLSHSLFLSLHTYKYMCIFIYMYITIALCEYTSNPHPPRRHRKPEGAERRPDAARHCDQGASPKAPNPSPKP